MPCNAMQVLLDVINENTRLLTKSVRLVLCLVLWCLALPYSNIVIIFIVLGALFDVQWMHACMRISFVFSVNKRLESSKNPTAKAVLTAMRDFVMEFKDKEPL